METYFHNDSRIEEWIDQITEKVFTVCLLTGLDSEAEYQRGCQIVTKVTSLLQGISSFPLEYLEDGLKQLVEQQLPDARVISNFPAFQDTMNKMLREGMSKAIDLQKGEASETIVATIANTELDHLEEHDQNMEITEVEVNEESMTPSAIPALASINITPSEAQEFEPELQDLELDELANSKTADLVERTPNEDTTINPGTETEQAINSKAYGMLRTTQVPKQADSLKRVLNNIFPNGLVNWNMNLMGQTFLAQVENILICLWDLEHPCLIEDFTKEGWKVYMCSTEDLTFPRRLERGIRQILRSGKKPKIV